MRSSYPGITGYFLGVFPGGDPGNGLEYYRFALVPAFSF